MGSFEKNRAKTGGRRKGSANKFSLDTRKAIVEALSQLGNEIPGGNRQGLIDFVKAACREDIRNGVKLLMAVTPKLVDLDVETTPSSRYRSIEEIALDLERRGLPKMKEIFEVDFRGTDPVIEPQAEILAPEASAKPA